MSVFDQIESGEASLLEEDVPPLDSAQRKTWLHYGLIALGWGFVAIGAVGAFLPVLPTTPFILLALWCFARSSKRFHDWLYHHPRFGPLARDWHDHRVIPPRAKLLSVTMMAASQAYVTFYLQIDWRWALAMGVTLAAVAAWILTRPSRAPQT